MGAMTMMKTMKRKTTMTRMKMTKKERMTITSSNSSNSRRSVESKGRTGNNIHHLQRGPRWATNEHIPPTCMDHLMLSIKLEGWMGGQHRLRHRSPRPLRNCILLTILRHTLLAHHRAHIQDTMVMDRFGLHFLINCLSKKSSSSSISNSSSNLVTNTSTNISLKNK